MRVPSARDRARLAARIGYELCAIAAAVLGGVSLRGGEGTVLGAIIGSCIMRVIDNGINMFQWVYRDVGGVRRISRLDTTGPKSSSAP
jgi:ribose transport system permease protein